MANRETYPASLSPLIGDVSAGAGVQLVTVVGLQNQPIDGTAPLEQQILRFSFTDPIAGTGGAWRASFDTNSAVYINGVPVSDDYDILVNAQPQVTVNGVG